MTLAALICASMTCFCGCVSYKVISADREIQRLKAAKTFQAPVDGWFVPDARWLEINDALSDKLQ